jgi:hypothetical protein
VTRFRGGNEDSERTSAAGATDHVDGLRARETVGTSQHDGDFDVSEGRRDFLKGVLAASGTVAWSKMLTTLNFCVVCCPRSNSVA